MKGLISSDDPVIKCWRKDNRGVSFAEHLQLPYNSFESFGSRGSYLHNYTVIASDVITFSYFGYLQVDER